MFYPPVNKHSWLENPPFSIGNTSSRLGYFPLPAMLVYQRKISSAPGLCQFFFFELMLFFCLLLFQTFFFTKNGGKNNMAQQKASQNTHETMQIDVRFEGFPLFHSALFELGI